MIYPAEFIDQQEKPKEGGFLQFGTHTSAVVGEAYLLEHKKTPLSKCTDQKEEPIASQLQIGCVIPKKSAIHIFLIVQLGTVHI